MDHRARHLIEYYQPTAFPRKVQGRSHVQQAQDAIAEMDDHIARMEQRASA
jgi:hypothetical protein